MRGLSLPYRAAPLQNALRVPMKTIASNAGVEGAVVVGKVGRQRVRCIDVCEHEACEGNGECKMSDQSNRIAL